MPKIRGEYKGLTLALAILLMLSLVFVAPPQTAAADNYDIVVHKVENLLTVGKQSVMIRSPIMIPTPTKVRNNSTELKRSPAVLN